MRRLIVAALLSSAALAHAQGAASSPSSAAKKELVQRLMVLQQPGIENLARTLVEQPAVQMMQAAGRALQQQVPADKREAVGKNIESDVQQYVEESVPIVREKAVKLAPSTIGVMMEEKFTEDELKQLIAWLESPINKKYSEIGPEIQSSFTQQLVAEARPVVDPRLQALETKVRAALGAAVSAASAPAGGKAGPAKKANGK